MRSEQRKEALKTADQKFKDKMKLLGRRARGYHATDAEFKIVKQAIQKLLKELRGNAIHT